MARNGKAFNEYLHQAAPEAPVMRFSDRPITVDGIRFIPKWAWSDGYRKHFRAMHSYARPQGYDPTFIPYRDWLRARGMTGNEADNFIHAQRG